jgi:cytochrome c oxidase subunit IV
VNSNRSVLCWKVILLNLVSSIGLIVWEFMQKSSRNLVFDYHDIVATLLGAVFAWFLFLFVHIAAILDRNLLQKYGFLC